MSDGQTNLNGVFSLAVDVIKLGITRAVDVISIENIYVDVDDAHIRTVPYNFTDKLDSSGIIVNLAPTTLGSIYQIQLFGDGKAVISAYFEMPSNDCFLSDLTLHTAYPPRDSYPVDVVNWGDIKGSFENQSDLSELVFTKTEADALIVSINQDTDLKLNAISEDIAYSNQENNTKLTQIEELLESKDIFLTEKIDSGFTRIDESALETNNNLASTKSQLEAKDAALQNQVNSIGGGHKAYPTYVKMTDAAALPAGDPLKLPANSSVDVSNDPDTAKNGRYTYNGSVFSRSAYDPQAIILSKVKNAFDTKALMIGSPLPDGSHAAVDNDEISTNNGSYKKTAGAWVKSAYDPVGESKFYVDTTATFKTQRIAAGSDLNTLGRGLYTILLSSDGDAIANMPPITSSVKVGVIDVILDRSSAYQRFYHYNSLEQWERVGNGSSSNLQYGAWVKVVKRADLDAAVSSISAKLASKPSLNLFKNVALTSVGATIYQATVADEAGYPTLSMDTNFLSSVFYDMALDNKYLKVGSTITLNASMFSDSVGGSAGDITVQALNSAGTVLAVSSTARNTQASIWEFISTSLTLPAGTTKILIRFIRRTGNTVVKFRNPVLSADSLYAQMIIPDTGGASTSSNRIVYVAKSGSDANIGALTSPFLTLQKGVDALATNGGELRVLDDGDYRESVVVDNYQHIKITASKGKRVNILGSDKLVLTKTTGFTKVYQAALAAKPVGMGGARGKPAIFEWGTKSKPIVDAERHFLHHGLTHRLPFTEMNEVTSKAELDAVGGNGKWFWESGIIYLSATDGSDASTKRYEARARPVITHINGTIELVRVTSWFSNNQGMDFKGISTKRSSCISWGALRDGFSDNANVTHSYRDTAGGCGNDGLNCTVNDYANISEINNRNEQIYYDPYGHDNGDDGLSCHYRSDSTVYGGLFEYNTKADVVHVTGANCVCYNTESRGTNYGFYAATPATGDAERVAGVFKCVSTIATSNNYSYIAADSGVLDCINTTSVTPAIVGYSQSGTGVLRANDCKFSGDTTKEKSGTVVVVSSVNLTP